MISAQEASNPLQSGYAGIEVNGDGGALRDFRAGPVSGFPETTITGGSSGTVGPNVSFTFSSSKSGSSFECALDAKVYGDCSSPKSYEGLSEGAHTFSVRAVDGGATDPTPAERTINVELPERNSNWRIEGSTLKELGAWGPYESKGQLELQTTIASLQATVNCKESGSGTLGYQETINLSECEVKRNGVTQKCTTKFTKPIELDSGFHSKNTTLTTLKFEGSECVYPESNSVKPGPGFTLKAGAEAVEFPASLAEETYVGAEVPANKAQISISSAWKLTGKYTGKKFAYAELASLNSKWHIKGAALAELGAWEPMNPKAASNCRPRSAACKRRSTAKRAARARWATRRRSISANAKSRGTG